MLLGDAPAGDVPGAILASPGIVPLVVVEGEDDIGADVDELVLPVEDIESLFEPVDAPAMPDVPLVDPDGAPPVEFDMLELSVLGAGGSVF